ncbi:MAG TPA: PTS sugar transporter subunit IIB [Anaeromyxobacter sp.]|nr:PTS sugar transporter subunit IIB [Anaeromyxobacter sp.]
MIALVRVDNRLLHGQILETWIPKLGIQEVVVADDEAAGSELARAAMTLCVPPELPARIVPLREAPWTALAQKKAPVLVLVRDVSALAAARASGLSPDLAPRVNVGNVHFGPGRKAVTPSVFLSAAELETLRVLAAAGFAIEARAIPSEPPAGMEDMERRYAGASFG